jgi:hypothetical protein
MRILQCLAQVWPSAGARRWPLAARISTALLLSAVAIFARAAHAIPAFAEQTGQPCAQCHVGAFGPQLKPYGRDFKLYGYTATDGEKHLPGFALTLQTGYTHTTDPQAGLVSMGYKDNSNLVADQQVSVYFGGRLAKEAGGFVQVTYDGTAAAWAWDNLDLRYAHQTRVLGADSVLGLSLNNSPTVQDAWNSSPVWGFPYNGSSLAATPAASALLDGGIGQQALGLTGYLLWNDALLGELGAYHMLNDALLNHLGTGSHASGSPADVYDGVLPYWRLSWYHDTDDWMVQAGATGLAADRFPAGDRSSGQLDRLRDRALDFNLQRKGNDDHYWSDHALLLHEDLHLDASAALGSAGAPSLSLDVFRADVSYSWHNTLTPTVQYFRTRGSSDAWWGTGDPAGNPAGSPNSRGWVFDLGYVPMGKPDSWLPWANARVGLQWIAYQQFDGVSAGAAGHDTLYLSLWLALSPTYALEGRH